MKNDEPLTNVIDNHKLLITVIVPVYNGENHLENCIRSIESQTYANIEVVIVNDGSTDGTAAVCDRLRTGYDNVSVLTISGEGVSVARNVGVGAAKGDYITFVDADDRLCPETLKVLYDSMVDTGSDIAGCGFFVWGTEEEWKQGAVRAKTSDGRAAGQTDVYDIDRYLKEALLCGNSRCWSKLYRREIFGKVRFPENLTIGEDMLFLVKMLPHVSKIVETDYKGYGYFQNPSGAMKREFTSRYMDQITCWELAREEIRRMDRSLDAQITTLYMMGIMLTAGKLAMLSAAERRENKKYIQICHEKLKSAMLVPGAYGGLSAGYRLKVRVFLLCPNLYLSLYHLRRLRKLCICYKTKFEALWRRRYLARFFRA